jgi:hypothetical protein
MPIEKTPPKESVEKNKDTGFICIYRSIKKHWLWKDNRVKTPFEAWIDLLLRASHDDQKEPIGIDFITVLKGQVLTSQLQLSKEWFWSRKKVCHFLNVLKKDGMLDVKSTTKWSMLTICNYASYQAIRTTKAQQKNIKGTTEEHIQPLEPLEPLLVGAEAPKPKTFKQWTDAEFYQDIANNKSNYSKEMLREFYEKWTEKSASGKMKFQLEDTWETKKRLVTWFKNIDRFGHKPDKSEKKPLETLPKRFPKINVA